MQQSRRGILAGFGATALLQGCGGAALAPRAEVGRAAVLVPLSGQAAGLGQSLRAAASLGGTGVGATSEVEILDSGASPESAARAAQAAVKAGAQVIVGPLFRDQTPAVVKAAGRIPVVTLSNDTDLARQGAWVFGLTPEHSAQAILGFAAGKQKRRIVVVVPEGPFGARAIAASQSLAKPLALQVSPVVQTGTGGLRDQVRRAAGGTMPDAVYLPAGGKSLARNADALRDTGVQVIGSAQWLGTDVGRMSALRGAWFAAPDPLRFEPFARALEDQTEAQAGILTGLAFDAAEMVRLLGRAGQQSPKGLAREEGFDGVLGPFRFARSRISQRGLGVLSVEKDAVTLIGSTAI